MTPRNTHVSDRDLLLAGGMVAGVPVLTVELYCKWYKLWLMRVGKAVWPIDFSELEEGFEGTAFVDHVPNPVAVRAYIERKGYHLDELAEELLEGRWKLEVEQGNRS